MLLISTQKGLNIVKMFVYYLKDSALSKTFFTER